MVSRLEHNRAVHDDTPIAAIDFRDMFKSVCVHTGHIEGVSAKDAIRWAEEHDEEIKEQIDEIAIHERGRDGIGYVEVVDGELGDFTIYAQYQR